VGIFGSNDKQDDDAQEVASREGAKEHDDGSWGNRVALGVVARMVGYGIKGVGPLDPVAEVVERARAKQTDPEKVIDEICSDHVRLAAGGDFVTGVGGIVTMPVALPANVVGFYVLAGRMVAGLVTVRGYDLDDPATRTAISLTLVGADPNEILRKAGVPGGKMAQIALDRVPNAARSVISKGVGFRLVSQMGARLLGRLGRAVPLAGGVIGAGLDGYLMGRLADHARAEFPQRDEVPELTQA
jgi:hypothetical protein